MIGYTMMLGIRRPNDTVEPEKDKEQQKHSEDYDEGNDDGNTDVPLLPLRVGMAQKGDEPFDDDNLSSSNNSNSMEILVPIRQLTYIVMALLLGSHVFLFRQCHSTYLMTKKESYVLGRYQVIQPEKVLNDAQEATTMTSNNDKNTTTNTASIITSGVNIIGKATSSHHKTEITRNILQPGDICETLEHEIVKYKEMHFYRTVYPTAGLLPKEILETNLEWIEFYNTTKGTSIRSNADDGSLNDSSSSSSSPYYSSWCPLIFDGWWPDENYQGWLPRSHRERQFLYAPSTLIMAQCLWNAMQVLQLFLLLALIYDFSYYDDESYHTTTKITSTCCRMAIGFIGLLSVVLLPFSVYVISLGGHIFAFLTFLTGLLALSTNVSILVIAVGEENKDENAIDTASSAATATCEEDNLDHHLRHQDAGNICNTDDIAFLVASSNTPVGSRSSSSSEVAATTTPTSSWIITREETIAFLGNLFCHMYNSRKPWQSFYFFVDKFFGWKMEGGEEGDVDVTPKMMYTLGSKYTRIPLFVSQANHSTATAYAFLFIWSILPFLYVCYFGIMYIVAIKSSPTPMRTGSSWCHGEIVIKFQRLICIFGIFNFLFITDIVAYRYGRGYRSIHEDMAHWWEHFAWRAAIVLPLYQNCTNGHWEHHPKYPIAGKIFQIAAAIYGIWFLVFQVIQYDVFQFITFLFISEERSFFEIMGWEHHPIIIWLNLNTPKSWATMIMTILYGFLHISGFPLYQVSIHRKKEH